MNFITFKQKFYCSFFSYKFLKKNLLWNILNFSYFAICKLGINATDICDYKYNLNLVNM